MALNKTYGKIEYGKSRIWSRGEYIDGKPVWKIAEAQPHVSIKLKSIFQHIRKSDVPPYEFPDLPQTCFDLLWFMERYPMQISDEDKKRLEDGRQEQIDYINEVESILLPEYNPLPAVLNEGEQARDYQLKGCEVFLKVKRLLLGDELGLGKTLTAILSFLKPEHRPVAVVLQAHLPRQWKEQIHRFTNLSVHLVKTRVVS